MNLKNPKSVTHFEMDYNDGKYDNASNTIQDQMNTRKYFKNTLK